MKEHPEPPTGVEVVYEDGSSQRVECHYLGVDDEGQHVWQVTSSVKVREVQRIRASRIPAFTTIVMQDRS